jgi:hypothetical protein
MNLKTGLRNTWSWLRQVSGDAAYENYLLATQRRIAQGVLPGAGGSARPLSRAEFYLDSVRRRYSTVSRCC